MSIAPQNEQPDLVPADRDSFGQLFAKSLAGCPAAFGQLLEGCRNYLLVVANEALDSGVRPKGGASDLVQDTFIEAQRDFARFRGTTERELLAWLKGILAHRVANHHRRYGAEKREIAREIPLELLGTIGTSPVAVGTNVAAGERVGDDEIEQLMAAIGQLPVPFREVLRMRTWQRMSFAEIGTRIGKSAEAARKQWGRAVRRLQQELTDGSARQ